MRTMPQRYSSPSVYTQEYSRFKGVDMSADPALIDESRSPFAPNLISDTGGNPEKRLGWRTVGIMEWPVNGIFSLVEKGARTFIIHGGTKLYKWNGGNDPPKEIYGGVWSGRSVGIVLAGKLWILTGREYLVYDGELIKTVESIAYVPLVIIARKPAGGGTTYENINMLTGKQKNSFLSDGSSKIYTLTAKDIKSVDEVTVNGTAVTTYTTDLKEGKVTFTTAPATPTVTGQDNVIITFTKEYTGYADRVKKCRTATVFAERIFITGNSDYPNRDWYCGLQDPTYFPDLNFTMVGDENTEIMGYCRLGQYLAIIKAENAQDSTLYLRQNQTTSEGEVAFPTFQGAVGVGAISRFAFANLIDEPLFLSRTGVYAISSNNINAERTLKNRSYFVDSALTKETNLKDAAACEWNGYYILSVNSNCYILDGKQSKSSKGQYSGDFSYECYHWTNVPARVLHSVDGELYFGTYEGKLCKFNTDLTGLSRYNDDGLPIEAYWSTKADDDGDYMSYKTMIKRGGGLLVKPYVRSGVKVLMRTDADAIAKPILEEKVDIFDWEEIDFERFTFNSNDAPQVIPFHTKVKKYLTLQIILKNDTLNEGFGVFGIIKRYTKGSFKK